MFSERLNKYSLFNLFSVFASVVYSFILYAFLVFTVFLIVIRCNFLPSLI